MAALRVPTPQVVWVEDGHDGAVLQVRVALESEFVHPVAPVATCAGGRIFADSFTVIACCWETRGDVE
jgi:hypothetical protein